MDPSSTAARVAVQRVTCRVTGPASARAYRRERQHLYPLEDFREALAVGGVVSSFCGLDVVLSVGDSSELVEADEPAVDDCVTCVDIWRELRLVRL